MSARKHMVLIPLVTLAATGYYTYFGQMVPQKEVHPPKEVEISAGLTTDEMIPLGQKIFAGKGTCAACHQLSGGTGRFPDLGNVGGTAATRKPGYTDIEYLAESLYRPNDYVVEGFNPGMPQINKPPIELSDQEIKAVIAYLQSLGGTPTIAMDTKLKWEGEAPPPQAGSSRQKQAEVSAGPHPALSPTDLMTTHLCATCHNLDKTGTLVGPSLFDVGKRLDRPKLYEALLDPDATVGEGFTAGMMGATLKGTGFFEKVTSEELKKLVNYLAEQKGN